MGGEETRCGGPLGMVTLMQRDTSGAGSQVEVLGPPTSPPSTIAPWGVGQGLGFSEQNRGHWAEWKAKKLEGQVGADHAPGHRRKHGF